MKRRSGLFKNVIYKIIYLSYKYKQDLTLNNLQWLICHSTQPNQIKPNLLALFFSENFDFSWICSPTYSVMCVFRLIIISIVPFSLQNSIPLSWLYIRSVFTRISKSSSFFCKQVGVVHVLWEVKLFSQFRKFLDLSIKTYY